MNDNIDDWINSLSCSNEEEEQSPSEAGIIPQESLQPEPEQPQAQGLSEEDFDNILEDYGFTPPEDVEAEEITEEESEEEEEVVNTDSSEEYHENMGEGRDLDAEEDANWQGAISPVVESSVMVDSDGREYVIDAWNGQRIYLHSEVVDAINSTSDSVASNILAANRELIASEEQATQVQQPETTPAPQDESMLPLNSPTILLDESTTRFSGAEWYNEIQRKSIIVAGCGGIGSNVSFQLARMHPASIVLYDDDVVETVNMAGQLFSRNDVGKAKVDAMLDMISLYTNMQNIYALRQRFEPNTEAGDIMICGFDNMSARKTFFEAWKNHVYRKPEEYRKNCLYLDGRLSMEVLQVLCITGDDFTNIARYENEYLFSDEDADATVCSMKQTTYLACMIGSVMVNLFINWAAGLLDPIMPYDLPFFTEYDAQNMIFKTVK